MISAEDEEVLGVFDFVGEQETDGLEGLLATVYIVAQEEVVGFWWKAAILEQPKQVVVLSMNIATDLKTKTYQLGRYFTTGSRPPLP